MKKKIRFIDKITKKGKNTPGGVITEVEVEVRDLEHFEAQRKFKSSVFIDRKKRSKNGYIKHKKPFDSQD